MSAAFRPAFGPCRLTKALQLPAQNHGAALPSLPEAYSVWLKGDMIAGHDPRHWRFDEYGNVLRLADHGNRQSLYGWEIDHIVPRRQGGEDHIDNKRPLHWRANVLRNIS